MDALRLNRSTLSFGEQADAVPRYLQRQDVTAVVPNGGGDAARGPFFHEENRAPSSSRAAGFGRFSSVPGGYRDQFIDQWGGDAGCIGATELPFFAQKPSHVLPCAAGHGVVHGARDFRNAFEVAEHVAIAIDVSLEDLPIVNPRLSGSSGVGQHEARLDLFRHDRYGFAMDAICIEMNCAHSAIEGRVVVLATGGNRDDLRLDVLRNHPHLFEAEIALGETR